MGNNSAIPPQVVFLSLHQNLSILKIYDDGGGRILPCNLDPVMCEHEDRQSGTEILRFLQLRGHT